MTLKVDGAVRGRPISTQSGFETALTRIREQNADLKLELRAAGQEMRLAGAAILAALHNGPDDVVIHRTAARLMVRGTGYAR